MRILQRKVKTPPRITDRERTILAILMDRYKQSTDDARQRLHQVMLIFKPDTVIRWHRELVRCKWTFKRKGKPGRLGMSSELKALIVRLAKENSRWGYDKIHWELLKLGHRLGVTSVRITLKRHKITPVSQRSIGSWRSFLGHYKDQILACDFFTMETIWLKTIYVLFFIELGTRRIYLAGCTTKPDLTWITLHARQVVWNLRDDSRNMRVSSTIMTRNSHTLMIMCFLPKGLKSFIPLPSSQSKCIAERWVRSVREECLDHILVLDENYLRLVSESMGNTTTMLACIRA